MPWRINVIARGPLSLLSFRRRISARKLSRDREPETESRKRREFKPGNPFVYAIVARIPFFFSLPPVSVAPHTVTTLPLVLRRGRNLLFSSRKRFDVAIIVVSLAFPRSPRLIRSSFVTIHRNMALSRASDDGTMMPA